MKTTISIIALIAFLMTSCRKARVCECTSVKDGKTVTVETYNLSLISTFHYRRDCKNYDERNSSLYSNCVFK